jgi:ABC-type antimicrobial peptide transport system permease subunit
MIPVAIGIIIGMTAAFVLARVLRPLLFQTTPTDILTYAGLSLVLAVVSLLACYIPARHALKVDPIVMLRHE